MCRLVIQEKGKSSLNMRRIIAILQCKATIPVIPSTNASYKKDIQALAEKLQYTGNDKKLSTTVQINEGITTPGAVADLGGKSF